jgi:hypothetical protein
LLNRSEASYKVRKKKRRKKIPEHTRKKEQEKGKATRVIQTGIKFS